MGSKSATGVLIVDDEEDMRALLRSTIEIANQGLHVAGEAADGEDAVKQWRETRPEIVVLDQRMPGATGLEVAEQILAEHPEQAIILFSAYLDPDIVDRAAQLGVRACMSKREISRVPEALWKYAPEP
ncbi:MAG: response regulator transcription factor [Acidimicrobiia bacterium]|nr:response regulator transcription factor [Acidimicrobiia bacterium]MBV9039488.1 response regulator transcription factor [Acidimicrobiia bacterium]